MLRLKKEEAHLNVEMKNAKGGKSVLEWTTCHERVIGVSYKALQL